MNFCPKKDFTDFSHVATLENDSSTFRHLNAICRQLLEQINCVPDFKTLLPSVGLLRNLKLTFND